MLWQDSRFICLQKPHNVVTYIPEGTTQGLQYFAVNINTGAINIRKPLTDDGADTPQYTVSRV